MIKSKAMTQDYQPQAIETKWQAQWEKRDLFQNLAAADLADQEKLYLLFAFAYPSGSGLHVGHVESKTALDILARYYRMQGKAVFFPVGWDAFGLPAENYAIKTGVPPAVTTKQAIDTFRTQIKRLAISYDWAGEIATSHPEYYRWTQWLFLQLYKAGLAYKAPGVVNWCPSCQTVLANEQVVEGACERCGSEVVQKELEQWYFKITEYRDELIAGLDQVDWPEPTKQQQLNWIGRKEGIEITYQVEDGEGQQMGEITCFTTRPDTNFGATFVVLAPEHQLAKSVTASNSNQADNVAKYLNQATSKTELERQQEGRKKTGVFTGLYALNPLTNYKMPVWVSDFVLGGFGTGAVVGVPGHDRRDFEFAQTFDLEVIRVVVPPDGDTSAITHVNQVFEDKGNAINSGFLDDLSTDQATDKVTAFLEEKGWGKAVTTYKLRDWLISRQRYWGAPIPIVYDPEGKPHPVKEEHLPWKLPEDVDFKPTGESPLKSSKEFFARVEKLYGKGWTPEVDTMDTFVDSSWYYLRYADPRNAEEFASKQRLEQWLPVDFYMIGPEHIVLHLLYSRFFTKFLRDQGYLTFDEPFLKMRHQGMILGPDHKKMSKSKGNVINPDDVIGKFGADTLRVYEMFMGPIEADKPWDDRAVIGVYKFLSRVQRQVAVWLEAQPQSGSADLILRRKIQQTVDKVGRDLPALKFNTAVAALMECLNAWEAAKESGLAVPETDVVAYIKALAPLAPFLAEELYQQVARGKADESVHLSAWPELDAELLSNEQLNLPVQVNGKLRAQLEWPAERVDQEKEIVEAAQSLDKIKPWLDGKKLRQAIYVSGKIVNLVVG